MKWLRKLFTSKPTRIHLKLVAYDSANAFLERGWTIAPEEDQNTKVGFVWLEKLDVMSTEIQP